MPNVKVVKSDPPESTEVLAEAIVRMGKAMKALQESGLNEDAIVVLVQAKTGISKKVIKEVFGALRRLEGWYCR